jgi:cell division protein FtsB
VSEGLRQRLAKLVDSLDTIVYALLFLLGFGGLRTSPTSRSPVESTRFSPAPALRFRLRSGGAAMGVWLTIGVVSLALVVALIDGESGLRTWWALRDDLRAAQARIAHLKSDVVELESEGGGLSGAGEPFAIERAIRERLVYARDGETLVRLDPPGDTSPRIP